MKEYKLISLHDWKLEEWEALENSNAHGTRLERIADYCMSFADGEAMTDLYAIRCMLNALNCQHDRIGHIPMWLYKIRENLRLQLRKVIGEEFGPSVLNRIDP